MRTSPLLRDLILRKQSDEEYRDYDSHLTACFSESGHGHLDVQIEFQQSPDTKDSSGKEGFDNAIWSNHDRDILKASNGKTLRTWRVQTVQELQQIVNLMPEGRRIFFARQRHSRSRLSVSRELFEHICVHYDIFEKFREVVLCFGLRKSELYTTRPCLRFQFLTDYGRVNFKHVETSFECAYLMQFVEKNEHVDGFQWSLRQSGVYHKHVTDNAEDILVFLALSSTIEGQLTSYLTQIYDDIDGNAFEIHYILIRAAMSGWKGCIAYLAEEVQRQSDMVFMTEFEGNDFHVTRLEERQYLKKVEDFSADLIAALAFMEDNLSRITEQYKEFRMRSKTLPASGSLDYARLETEIDSLLFGFESTKQDLAMFRAQMDSLQRKVRSVSTLVSNILDLNNGDALKLLAVETKQENARMAVLTQKSVQDAASVKVLTIVTLVYLPLTVVTNFFSTSFVGSKTNNSSTQQITVAPDVWVLFVIGVPLTFITIWLWWVFAQKEITGVFPGRIEHMVRYLTRQKSGATVGKVEAREADVIL